MREVTQDEFYAFIKARGERDDPMPSVEQPHVTVWTNRRGNSVGRIVARSYPGWRNPRDPKRYEVEE